MEHLDHRIEDVYDLYTKCKSLEHTALFYRVEPSDLVSLFEKHGKPIVKFKKKSRRLWQRYSPDFVKKMYNFYINGNTLNKTAEKFNVPSNGYLSRLFRQHGLATKKNGALVRKKRGARPDVLRKAAKAVELYKEGETLEQIGARFGVTRERVRQWMEHLGVGRRSVRNIELHEKMSSIKDDVEKMYCQDGFSRKRIAEELDIPIGVVDRCIQRYKMKKKFKRDSYPIEEWEKLYEEGVSTIEIGKRFQLSNSIVSNRLRAAGVKMRNKYLVNSIPQKRVEKAIELKKQGWPNWKICLEVGMSGQTLIKYLEKHQLLDD